MRKIVSYALLSAMLFSSSAVFAKTLNLYSEPKADSKVTGTVNTDKGVTIVYTPKTGEWIKVANPSNGDVGWVKSSELGGNGYHLQVMTSDDGAKGYRFYQVGTGSVQSNQNQLEKEMRLFEQQQLAMQQHMAHMFNDMFGMVSFPHPLFVPVVMVSEQPQQQNAASPAKVIQATQPAQKTQTTQVNKS